MSYTSDPSAPYEARSFPVAALARRAAMTNQMIAPAQRADVGRPLEAASELARRGLYLCPRPKLTLH